MSISIVTIQLCAGCLKTLAIYKMLQPIFKVVSEKRIGEMTKISAVIYNLCLVLRLKSWVRTEKDCGQCHLGQDLTLFWMLCRVDLQLFTDVSGQRI
jgi:hypothetical protein